MSYDISLRDAATGQTVELAHAHNLTGGTYQVGGSRHVEDPEVEVIYVERVDETAEPEKET